MSAISRTAERFWPLVFVLVLAAVAAWSIHTVLGQAGSLRAARQEVEDLKQTNSATKEQLEAAQKARDAAQGDADEALADVEALKQERDEQDRYTADLERQLDELRSDSSELAGHLTQSERSAGQNRTGTESGVSAVTDIERELDLILNIAEQLQQRCSGAGDLLQQLLAAGDRQGEHIVRFYSGWLPQRTRERELEEDLHAQVRRANTMEARATAAENTVRQLRESQQRSKDREASLEATILDLRDRLAEVERAQDSAMDLTDQTAEGLERTSDQLRIYGWGEFLGDAAICAACGLAGAGICAVVVAGQ